MDNIFRIFSPDFKPEDVDVLSAYEQVECPQIADVVYRKVKLSYDDRSLCVFIYSHAEHNAFPERYQTIASGTLLEEDLLMLLYSR